MAATEVETDPCLHDTWLSRLSPEEEDALRARWNRQVEKEARETCRDRRRAMIDYGAVVAAFLLAEVLLAVVAGWSVLGLVTGLAVGTFLGGLVLVLEAPRVFALVIGAAGLFAQQWMVRRGLGPVELGLLVPPCAIFWIVGKRRELCR